MATTTGISFDGVNDQVTKTWSGKTNSSNKKFTVSAWLEVPTGASGETAYFNADNGGGGTVIFGITGTDGYLGIVPAQRPFIYVTNDNSNAVLQYGGSNIVYGTKYFFMLVYDSAQATQSNRFKTWFGPYAGAVAQISGWTDVLGTGVSYGLNETLEHGTGSGPMEYLGTDSGSFFKYKAADVYWLDNVALADPSSLLSNYASAAKPGTYSGSYGNTGYHLDFASSGSLGADVSGNSNNFTPSGGPTQLTGYFPSGGYTLSAAAGSYAITGTAATLKRGKAISAAAGSYAVTGTAAGLKRALKVSAAAGSYAVTGTAAGVKRGRKVAAAAGSYAVTGSTAGLKQARKVAASAGSYTVTGTAATLAKSSAKSIGADPGSYAVTGTAAGLRASRKVAAGPGTYAVAGTDASLRRGKSASAGAGSYSVTGTAAALVRGRSFGAGAGSYSVTGSTAALRRDGRLSAGAGAYSVTGVSASLRRGGALGAGSGSYALTGTAAAIRRERRLGAGAGSYAITGTSATLTYVPVVGRVSYPSDYPQPLVNGFNAQIAMGVIRAPGPTDQAQRRIHTTMPHMFSLTFIMSVTQWGLWYQWATANGYDWFLMNLPTFYAGLSGSTLSPVLIRFTSGFSANNVSGSDVQVTVAAESAPSMISQYLEAV